MTTRWGAPLVLARGDDYLIASKPAGLATTGRTLEDPDSFQSELMLALRRRKVWAVHQLDKGTSGACLFALKKAAVSQWAERLKRGRKLYLALCDGRMVGTHEVQACIGRVVRADGRTQSAITPSGKDAHSTIWPLETSGDRTLCVAQIHTGRTHQVRLHLSHIGFPLVGESMHRDPPCTLLPYPALHAWCLELGGDPRESLKVVAPLPASFCDLLEGLGFARPRPETVGF